MYARHELGKQSEQTAEEWFLNTRRARLLARNYRSKTGEIDLIFEESPQEGTSSPIELVFVEVRSRSRKSGIGGPESVTLQKQKRLRSCASHYLSQYRGIAKNLRFDLIYREGENWGYLPNIWIY